MRRPEFAVLLARLIKAAVVVSSLPLRTRAKIRMQARLIETLNPVVTTRTKHGDIRFYCPATWPFVRSGIKGPHITDWIDALGPRDILWDVGANVGVYSLYAARKGLRVVAFEPEAQNFAIMARNININGFTIDAFNLALHNETQISQLRLSSDVIGSAQHHFGAERGQSTIGYAIDDFAKDFATPFPTHIKIDVDGNESLILAGAHKTLRDPRLKGAVVETRPHTYGDVCQQMLDAGFSQVSHENKADIFFERQVATA